jgi:hypothetical protein
MTGMVFTWSLCDVVESGLVSVNNVLTGTIYLQYKELSLPTVIGVEGLSSSVIIVLGETTT